MFKELMKEFLAGCVCGAIGIAACLWIGYSTHFLRTIPKDKIAAVRHAVES
jgi:hypothetical protein